MTIEYKVNFLSPARGERMLARGRVIRPGRTVTVCSRDVLAVIGGAEKVVATMLATMATVTREGRHLPRAEASVETAHDHRTGPRRGSSRTASPWLVCRGGGLRRRLKEMVTNRGPSRPPR